MACSVCRKSELTPYTVLEMQLGTNVPFTYVQCGECGCLQLVNSPEDMGAYYPSNYYSFSPANAESDMIRGRSGPRTWLRSKRDQYAIMGQGPTGRILQSLRPNRAYTMLSLLRHTQISINSRILDVGCGSGGLLRQMHRAGFRQLLGVDPFLRDELDLGDRFRIIARSIYDVQGKWDLIMLHHSLEHLPDQREALEKCRSLLKPDGACLIRTPIAAYAWNRYRTNWVQIDAPRHYLVHTEKSLDILARAVGFGIWKTHYDSTGFQFWGSEAYARGYSLNELRSYGPGGPRSLFSQSQLLEYEQRAQHLNMARNGDQAAFLLRVS